MQNFPEFSGVFFFFSIEPLDAFLFVLLPFTGGTFLVAWAAAALMFAHLDESLLLANTYTFIVLLIGYPILCAYIGHKCCHSSQAQIVNLNRNTVLRSAIVFMVLVFAQIITISMCVVQLVILQTKGTNFEVIVLTAVLSVATGITLAVMIVHKVHYLRTFNVGCCS